MNFAGQQIHISGNKGNRKQKKTNKQTNKQTAHTRTEEENRWIDRQIDEKRVGRRNMRNTCTYIRTFNSTGDNLVRGSFESMQNGCIYYSLKQAPPQHLWATILKKIRQTCLIETCDTTVQFRINHYYMYT